MITEERYKVIWIDPDTGVQNNAYIVAVNPPNAWKIALRICDGAEDITVKIYSPQQHLTHLERIDKASEISRELTELSSHDDRVAIAELVYKNALANQRVFG